MSSVLRPRLDVTVVLAGERHQLATTLRDSIELKRRFKALTGDMEDVAKLTWLAAQRTGVFAGTFDEFVDACDDIEAAEPPPLGSAAGSPDSSPQSPEPPE